METLPEELTQEDLDVNLTISAIEPGEKRPPGDIVSIIIDATLQYKPSELIELGQWFILKGKEIARDYDDQGRRK